MVKITWFNDMVPEGMKITQSYGIIFDKKGRVLLKVENKKDKKVYSFAGGTPEAFDKDVEQTLRRELIEEINTTIEKEVCYLGYQCIEGDGDRAPYAQVRMTAMIDQIGDKQPDPDNGKTYDRVLVCPSKAIELLGWGEVGQKQIEKAVQIAKEKFNIKESSLEEEWI